MSHRLELFLTFLICLSLPLSTPLSADDDAPPLAQVQAELNATYDSLDAQLRRAGFLYYTLKSSFSQRARDAYLVSDDLEIPQLLAEVESLLRQNRLADAAQLQSVLINRMEHLYFVMLNGIEDADRWSIDRYELEVQPELLTNEKIEELEGLQIDIEDIQEDLVEKIEALQVKEQEREDGKLQAHEILTALEEAIELQRTIIGYTLAVREENNENHRFRSSYILFSEQQMLNFDGVIILIEALERLKSFIIEFAPLEANRRFLGSLDIATSLLNMALDYMQQASTKLMAEDGSAFTYENLALGRLLSVRATLRGYDNEFSQAEILQEGPSLKETLGNIEQVIRDIQEKAAEARGTESDKAESNETQPGEASSSEDQGERPQENPDPSATNTSDGNASQPGEEQDSEEQNPSAGDSANGGALPSSEPRQELEQAMEDLQQAQSQSNQSQYTQTQQSLEQAMERLERARETLAEDEGRERSRERRRRLDELDDAIQRQQELSNQLHGVTGDLEDLPENPTEDDVTDFKNKAEAFISDASALEDESLLTEEELEALQDLLDQLDEGERTDEIREELQDQLKQAQEKLPPPDKNNASEETSTKTVGITGQGGGSTGLGAGAASESTGQSFGDVDDSDPLLPAVESNEPNPFKWGNMTPAERKEALEYLQERFPASYRKLIEQYYRALAEEDVE